MVRFTWIVEQREFGLARLVFDTPVEIVGVNDNAANGVAMAADPFCATGCEAGAGHKKHARTASTTL